ncbi:hypothetical protein F8M41_000360 [Gigaspora margarita]|uniref:Uncharacterized protein n=1 Tax=Gigaspora margarita TaxID=4874 RepID=A0A8H4AZJ9_GIGMA|nr:hypothetical protein F8M41_000360 [Gigaspora margarita]
MYYNYSSIRLISLPSICLVCLILLLINPLALGGALGVWCTYEALLPLRKFLNTITEYSFLIFKQLRKFFFNNINNISIINIETQQYSRDSYYHISLEIMKPSTNNSVTILSGAAAAAA